MDINGRLELLNWFLLMRKLSLVLRHWVLFDILSQDLMYICNTL